MSKADNLTDFMTDLADTIREVEGTSEPINPQDFSARIGNLSTGGGSGMQPVTYAELKALRDNGQLVAGKQYRITDYECTTTQENTRSAGHQFDIIVTADSESVLNENARAIQHEEIFDVDISEGGVLKTGAVTKYYDIYEDFDGDKNTDYKAMDVFIECRYAENNEGETVPVLYKTDVEMMEEGADYADAFFYVGRYEYNGETYDRWRKIEADEDTEIKWDAEGKIYALTNIIVDDNGIFNPDIIATGSVIDPYFAKSKLSAWELKYSLDNDNTRFAWAGKQAISGVDSYNSNGKPLIRQPQFDNSLQGDFGIYRYAWGVQADVEAEDIAGFVYSKTEKVEVGDVVYVDTDLIEIPEVVELGKGVIYYMKDEWGNECPYDFKNIQFKRWQTDEQIENDDRYYSSWEDTGNEWMWCYTFMAYNKHTEDWEDASIVEHFEWMNDENRAAQCSCNAIKPYELGYDRDETDTAKQGVLWLNNIVLYGTYAGIKEGEDEFNYYSAYMPQANTFAYNCYNMTLGYFCYSNTFGNSCNSNTLGNDCSYNTLGDGCHSNTFGEYSNSNIFADNCYSNTFGINCHSNAFGKGCYYNTFGNYCSSNIFGKDCYSNTFADNCSSNTFSYSCNQNDFGSSCTHNAFGNSCNSNTFGINCDYNTFGNYFSRNTFDDDCRYNAFSNNCSSNTFGSDCKSNTFGNNCSSNTFGINCDYNTFGNYCNSNTFRNECNWNTFGNDCQSNIFGIVCNYNAFGDDCDYNTFGSYCLFNTFGNGCIRNTFGEDAKNSGEILDYCRYIIFENGVSYVNLVSSTGSDNNKLKNIKVCLGIRGSSSTNPLLINVLRGLEHETKFVAAGSTTTEVEVDEA